MNPSFELFLGSATGVASTLNVGGTLASSGSLSQSVSKAFDGAISSSGTVTLTVGVGLNVAGGIAMSGAASFTVTKSLGGTISPAGSLTTSGGTPGGAPVLGAVCIVSQAVYVPGIQIGTEQC